VSIGLLAERAVRGLVRETEHRWGIAPVVRCTLGVALVGWSLRMWTVRKFAGVVKFFVVMFLFVWSSSHVACISFSSSALRTAPLVADLFYRCRPQVYVPHTCYSPYSFSSRLSVLVLTPHSSSVGTILLRLVSLHVPCRVHFLFPFPLVTDLMPFSELPTGRGLICSSLLTFLADVSCPISRTCLSPKPILSYRLVIHLTHTIPWYSLLFYDYASLCT
jgi:hypothetical protein